MVSKRRAVREATEYRDRVLRLEKEVEKLRGKMDVATPVTSGTASEAMFPMDALHREIMDTEVEG